MKFFPTALIAVFGLSGIGFSQEPITALSFTPDGQSVVVGSPSQVEVRSWPDLLVVRRLPVTMSHVHDLIATKDFLIVMGGEPAQYGAIEVFDWEGERNAAIRRHEDVIHAGDWNPESMELATASRDTTVMLGGLDEDPPPRTLFGHSRGVLAVRHIPGTQLIVSGGLDNTLRVWSSATLGIERILDNHRGIVRDLVVKPGKDGLPVIASAGADRTIRLWQPTIGRFMRYATLPAEPLSLVWTHEGSSLVASCIDGKLRVIDPEDVRVTKTISVGDGWIYALRSAPRENSVVTGDGHGNLLRIDLN
jgi:WD40 repeat protein